MNAALLEAVNASGEAFLIHTELSSAVPGEKLFTLRFALGSTNTQRRHVEAAWRLIDRKASEVLREKTVA
jgi:aromatic-L-amino-acid/L-tryptophan decarboxylase